MAKKDVELELNKTQMADMMKAMKNFQQQPQQPPADTFASDMFPNAISRELDFSRKNPGNFLSRVIYQHMP